MASRQRRAVSKRFGPKLVTVAGRFFPAGTSTDPLTVHTDGGVASVARSAQGTFLVTFQDAYYRLVDWSLGVQCSSATDLKPQLGDVSNLGTSTACTAVVRLLAVATATDLASNANNSVSFSFTFAESAIEGDVP